MLPAFMHKSTLCGPGRARALRELVRHSTCPSGSCHESRHDHTQARSSLVQKSRTSSPLLKKRPKMAIAVPLGVQELSSYAERISTLMEAPRPCHGWVP